MTRLVPDIAWRTAEREPRLLDARLLPLLREIRRHATLRAAVGAVGLSYRSGWDLLGQSARSLGAPLVVLERGRGTRLAPLGERLLEADNEARRALEAARERLTVKLQPDRGSARLRCIASHDLLLAEFVAAAQLEVDLSFRGSLESVGALARGEAEIAGFHAEGTDAQAMATYRAYLHPRRHCLVRFAAREQGLLLPRGNPRRIRSLADVARKRVRFLNRQRGSGTRVLIDRLFGESGVSPEDVRGYHDEEFTHLAVAARVASGGADAGVGVRAAAGRFALAFVPLRDERYWLAVVRRGLQEPPMRRFLEALRGPTLRRLAKRLSGYDIAGAGDVVASP